MARGWGPDSFDEGKKQLNIKCYGLTGVFNLDCMSQAHLGLETR